MFNTYKIKNYNIRLVIYALVLNIIGIAVISSATFKDARLVNKQILGIFIGLFIMFIISLLDYKKILNFSIAIYVACVVILLAVLLFGISPVGAGAKRWIDLPFIGRIQPSEFVKPGAILFFTWYLSKYNENINNLKTLLIFLITAGIIYLLILREPDLSTTIVLVVTTLAMLYIAGISYKWILTAFSVFVPLAGIFILLVSKEAIPFLRGYQANRILAWVNPAKYADANWQQDNSIMAIGSGSLFGKGLNNTTVASVKNGNFLSEEQTDFIFAIIGEELGFIGSVAVVIIFSLLVFEILYMASKTADMQGRLICTGFAVLIAFQSFTNIAVATGLFPNTGLPLPFISYGVSSLMSMYAGLGFVLNVGLQKDN